MKVLENSQHAGQPLLICTYSGCTGTGLCDVLGLDGRVDMKVGYEGCVREWAGHLKIVKQFKHKGFISSMQL